MAVDVGTMGTGGGKPVAYGAGITSPAYPPGPKLLYRGDPKPGSHRDREMRYDSPPYHGPQPQQSS